MVEYLSFATSVADARGEQLVNLVAFAINRDHGLRAPSRMGLGCIERAQLKQLRANLDAKFVDALEIMFP